MSRLRIEDTDHESESIDRLSLSYIIIAIGMRNFYYDFTWPVCLSRYVVEETTVDRQSLVHVQRPSTQETLNDVVESCWLEYD